LDEAYVLAYASAREAVIGMRQVFVEFAHEDPYETGHPDAGEDHEDVDGLVSGMATIFMDILNRQGLLKIDP